MVGGSSVIETNCVMNLSFILLVLGGGHINML